MLKTTTKNYEKKWNRIFLAAHRTLTSLWISFRLCSCAFMRLNQLAHALERKEMKWTRTLFCSTFTFNISSIFITSGSVIYADASARARYDFICMQRDTVWVNGRRCFWVKAGCQPVHSETFGNIFCFICIFCSYANAFKCVIDRRVTVQVYTHTANTRAPLNFVNTFIRWVDF